MKRHFRPQQFSDRVKRAVLKSQNGICALFPHDGCTMRKYLSPHHRIANTQSNCNRWPNLIPSVWNLSWVCLHGHTHFKHLLSITDAVADMYEDEIVRMLWCLPPGDDIAEVVERVTK